MPSEWYRLGELLFSDSGEQAGSGCMFSGSALEVILQAISKAYQDHQIGAVRVNIHRGALERLEVPGSDGVLIIDIVEGKVGEVRVLFGQDKADSEVGDLSRKVPEVEIATMEGISFDHLFADAGKGEVPAKKEQRSLQRIRDYSAIQAGDLVRLDELEQYLAYLNRHPGRQVEAALAPRGQRGELSLDYLVYERKVPIFYGRISNTGTKQTSRCREQFGLIDYNLSGTDDILYLDYITGNFDSVHGVSVGYERSLDDIATRDATMTWQDRIDWTRVRTKVDGSWREYEATEVGLVDQRFSGESRSVGGELRWNFYQKGSLFVDFEVGLQFSRVKVDNELAGTEGKSDFLLPYLGIRAEQESEKGNMHASLRFEFNLPNAVRTDGEGSMRLDTLGRTDTDRRWHSWQFSWDGSIYLEPVLDGKWKQPNHHSTLAHELFSSVRGQLVPHNNRVPANYMQTAGGFATVRGYPESFTSGDNGFLGTAEYRYHVPRSFPVKREAGKLFGRTFRFQPTQELGYCDWDLIFRGFLDVGWITKNDRQSYEEDYTLIGCGTGVELSLGRNLKLRADWGWPLRTADNGEEKATKGSSRVHLSMTVIY
jgi:hemolysin activation/secretion protein